MANVNVTYQQMHEMAGKLNNGRVEIDDMLGRLKSMVEGLVSEGYVTDSSSVQFRQAYEEFTKGASQTIEGLEHMGQYLSKAAQTFQDADTQLASALNH